MVESALVMSGATSRLVTTSRIDPVAVRTMCASSASVPESAQWMSSITTRARGRAARSR